MEELNVSGLVETVERLSAAASALEQAVERMSLRQESFAAEAQESVGRIVATVESAREAELERKLAAAEARLAELSAAASAATTSAGRKTVHAGVARMLAKEGVAVESIEAGAVDAALVSLSLEQRIALKSELLRAVLLG